MTINLKNLCVALMLVILPPFQASADEVTDAVNDVAAKLVQQLPMNQKIALKSLSPDETGLPEDFLRMLTSELAASLLKASNFQLRLMNKFTTEELWQEAIEFGDADFDALYASSQSDIMVMLSPRLSKNGLSFSVDAYRLSGGDAGTLLASSGLTQLNIDVEKEFGVNIKTLNQQVDTMIKLLNDVENKTELRAEVKYDRYEGSSKIDDNEFPDMEDKIVATVNGRKLAVEHPYDDAFEFPFFRGDLDNDGFLDLILRLSYGGNAPNEYLIISYRGETRFEKIHIATTYFEPTMVQEGFRWMIRLKKTAIGSDTELEDSIEEVRLKDGKVEIKKVGSLAKDFFIEEFTSEEAIEKSDSNGVYIWSFDFDADSKDETLECTTWARWGVMGCTIHDEKESWDLGTTSGGGCKVISVIDELHDGFYKLKCDFDDIFFTKSNEASVLKNKVVKVACAFDDSIAKISNVQNFTNLRQQAGLNGQVIGQVPLGATVSVVNPGSFLRYDRCAATCNGTNQNAIKQCIDNNDVWIEVQYNGRRGFLSRKFLE